MKKYLGILFSIFLFSCSNNFQNETKEKSLTNLSQMEKVFFGYDEDKVYDSSINIKLHAFNNDELSAFVSSLKNLNVKEVSREKGFREGEMYLTVKAFDSYPETLKKIRQMKGVFYAEPNYKMNVIAPYNDDTRSNILKPLGLLEGNLDNDPLGDKKGYSLAITKALDAYKKFKYGDHQVWAGIIDSGSNGNHEDLIYENGTKVVQILKTAFGPGGNIIDDTTGNTDVDQNGGHGTHCTGIICAVGNNNKGIAGSAWKNVKFASYKAMQNGAGSDQTIYGSLRDLVDSVRARVSQEEQGTIPVNMSLGGVIAGSYGLEFLDYALSKGVLPVVANGNDGQLLPNYPAAYPGVLSVGASTDGDVKTGFSTCGSWLNVVAPGLNIISLQHSQDTGYVYMSGTSMATPFVTGVIAYLLSFNPKLTPYQIITLLEETADKIDAHNQDPIGKYDENGFSLWYGYGRVNVYEATKKVREAKIPPKGKKYVETVLKIEANYSNSPVHIYDRNTGALVTMVLTNGYPASAEVRGLRHGAYNVVFNEKSKEIIIGNDSNVSVKF